MNDTVEKQVEKKIESITAHLEQGYTELLKLLQTSRTDMDNYKESYLDDLHDASKQLFNLMKKVNP
jgi:hypothetical protein